jgi:hypothetical protein
LDFTLFIFLFIEVLLRVLGFDPIPFLERGFVSYPRSSLFIFVLGWELVCNSLSPVSTALVLVSQETFKSQLLGSFSLAELFSVLREPNKLSEFIFNLRPRFEILSALKVESF